VIRMAKWPFVTPDAAREKHEVEETRDDSGFDSKGIPHRRKASTSATTKAGSAGGSVAFSSLQGSLEPDLGGDLLDPNQLGERRRTRRRPLPPGHRHPRQVRPAMNGGIMLPS